MSESMQESLNEALSAAIDSEAEELELRRVLNAVGGDSELRAKWERLHLIGGIIRGEATWPRAGAATAKASAGGFVAVPPESFESVRIQVGTRYPARWLGPVTGVAVAAAVMLAVYLDTVDKPGTVNAETPVLELASSPQPERVPSEVDLRRAHAYLMRHAQHTSIMPRTPAMPFIKVLAVRSEDEDTP